VTGQLLLQIVAGIGGLAGLGTLVSALTSRPKVRAEATQIATQTANETTNALIVQLRAEIDRVKDDNDGLRERVAVLEKAEDVNDQKVRDTRSALWECWQVIKRQHSYLTDAEKAEIGPLPDIDRFFPPTK
jgi:hypothetical protein